MRETETGTTTPDENANLSDRLPKMQKTTMHDNACVKFALPLVPKGATVDVMLANDHSICRIIITTYLTRLRPVCNTMPFVLVRPAATKYDAAAAAASPWAAWLTISVVQTESASWPFWWLRRASQYWLC